MISIRGYLYHGFGSSVALFGAKGDEYIMNSGFRRITFIIVVFLLIGSGIWLSRHHSTTRSDNLAQSGLVAVTDGGIWLWQHRAWQQLGTANDIVNQQGITSAAMVSGTLTVGLHDGFGHQTSVWQWKDGLWQPVAQGTMADQQGVSAMIAYKNRIIVAFNNGSGDGIWEYRHKKWSLLGSFNNLVNQVDVSSLLVIEGQLYAGTEGDGVWEWRYHNWILIGKPGDRTSSITVASLCSYHGSLIIAAGVNGVYQLQHNRWIWLGDRGGAWSLALWNKRLAVGTGQDGVLLWDGHHFTSLGHYSMLSAISALVKYHNSLYTGGSKQGVLKWNNRQWESVGPALSLSSMHVIQFEQLWEVSPRVRPIVLL